MLATLVPPGVVTAKPTWRGWRDWGPHEPLTGAGPQADRTVTVPFTVPDATGATVVAGPGATEGGDDVETGAGTEVG